MVGPGFSVLVSLARPLPEWSMTAAILLSVLFCIPGDTLAGQKLFRVGASIIDISPTNFPVIVNAMFTERSATQTVDRLEARALALDDGSNRIVITVVDSCM